MILAHSSGWSLAYSGDCRPSRQMAAAVRGVQVMIHEATFEDDLADHAVSKRHSTSGEALAVAGEAAAECTILTHFSQRYPKAVATGTAVTAETAGTAATAGTADQGGVGDSCGETGSADDSNAFSSAPAATVITAFDGMRVRWDRRRHLPATMGRVNAMFLAHQEERVKSQEDR